MKDKLIIGLDLGTTNAKAQAYDLEGNVIATSVMPYKTYFPHPGWAEQRPSDWQEALTITLSEITTELGERRRNVVGIGLSAHGPGLILVDKTGQPILNSSPTWQDERCQPQGKWLLCNVGSEWIGLGMPLTSFPAKLLWAIQEQPEITRQARYALGIKEFLVGWLTGRFITEPSSGPGRNEWYEPVFNAIQWDVENLAQVCSPTTVCGYLLPSIANVVGLDVDLPIVIGLNDGASATLAAGAVQPGDAIVTLATNGVARLILNNPISPIQCLKMAFFCWPYLENTWVVGGQTKCGASSLQWISQILQKDHEGEVIERISTEAASSPIGSRGIVFLPYLMGRGSPKDIPNATAAFTGLSIFHEQSDIVRAVMEGVSYAISDIFDGFSELNLSTHRLFMTGGGAKSSLWRQILSDVLGMKLTYVSIDSALGAAMITAVGLGLFSNISVAVNAMSHPHGGTEPCFENQEKYASLVKQYRRMRDQLTTEFVENLPAL